MEHGWGHIHPLHLLSQGGGAAPSHRLENHGNVWVGRDLRDHLVPTLVCSSLAGPTRGSEPVNAAATQTIALVLQGLVVIYCRLLTANHLLQQCLLTAVSSWPGLSSTPTSGGFHQCSSRADSLR